MFNPYLLDIQPIGPTDQARFKGYLITSTAPVNVEDAPRPCEGGDPRQEIAAMADFLAQNSGDAPVEILIQIHGYNTDADYIKGQYEATAAYLADRYHSTPGARLFLCYRWSSEPLDRVLKHSIQLAQAALPQLLRLIARSSKFGMVTAAIGLIFGLLLVISEGMQFVALLLLFLLLLFVAVVIITPIFTLLTLRVTNYFRDVHRADNYGVLDLIEFIRQLDRAAVAQTNGHWDKPRIRLSFVGYSMGAFVVTQAVRILSDVFDRQSISALDMSDRTTPPPSELGNVFRLGRLVLVAPDISTESVISGRGNTLRSSLRRFEEAYLFCNEGDLALRGASTVANYFSFPAGTREGGYRLGALTVRKPQYKTEKTLQYGVLNLEPKGNLADRKQFLDHLSIRPGFSLRQRQDAMWGHNELRQVPQNAHLIEKLERKPIAELFTYFDCTDYLEEKGEPVLGLAAGKASLGYLDLVKLAIATAKGKIDPHGGYLRTEAVFCRELIFDLGFLGFGQLLDQLAQRSAFADCYTQVQACHSQLNDSQTHRLACLQLLSQLNAARGIQVLLAPERYNVDVMAGKTNRRGY